MGHCVSGGSGEHRPRDGDTEEHGCSEAGCCRAAGSASQASHETLHPHQGLYAGETVLETNVGMHATRTFYLVLTSYGNVWDTGLYH